MTNEPPDTAATVTNVRLRDRWRSVRAQRRAGRLMIGVGAIGAILALVGTITAFVFVGEISDATDDSLAVTEQTLDAVDDTIDLAADVLDSTTDAVDALAGTLDAVSGSFDAGTTAIDDIADLADTIGPSLDEAASTTRTLETVGNDIDGVLGALSSIPFGPDYDPAAGLGDTFGDLADALEPLPDQLSTTATSLTDFTDSATELQTQLSELAASVQSVSADLTDSDTLVDQYRASVDEARLLAARTRDDLGTNVRVMRILIVIGGATFLLGQVVPLWVGRSLLDDADEIEEVEGIGHGPDDDLPPPG